MDINNADVRRRATQENPIFSAVFRTPAPPAVAEGEAAAQSLQGATNENVYKFPPMC